MKDIEPTKGEIVMYQPDETIRLEVLVENETVWLSQAQMAELFGTKRPAITKHINNIYKCGELKEQNTCSILEHMGNDGKQLYVTKYYNLDAIISVGFRVNTKRGIEFRQWANHVVYLFGASLIDAGKKLFANIRMQETSATELLSIIR